MRVALLDRANFPRPKLLGGLLAAKRFKFWNGCFHRRRMPAGADGFTTTGAAAARYLPVALVLCRFHRPCEAAVQGKRSFSLFRKKNRAIGIERHRSPVRISDASSAAGRGGFQVRLLISASQ
jgi:hypothetical protein